MDSVYLIGRDSIPSDYIFDSDYGVRTYTQPYESLDYGISPLAVVTNPNNPITSSSGLKGVLLNLFGPYEAVIVEYRYQNPSSTSYSYVREIQPDYVWGGSLLVFLCLLFCVLRMFGGMLCKR